MFGSPSASIGPVSESLMLAPVSVVLPVLSTVIVYWIWSPAASTEATSASLVSVKSAFWVTSTVSEAVLGGEVWAKSTVTVLLISPSPPPLLSMSACVTV